MTVRPFSRFQGDDALDVIQAQREVETIALQWLVNAIDARWKDAESLLGVRTELGNALRAGYSIANADLAEVYDILAAIWRRREHIRQPSLPLEGSETPHLMRRWLAWLDREGRYRLSDEHCRLLIEAVVTEDADRRQLALRRLGEGLRQRLRSALDGAEDVENDKPLYEPDEFWGVVLGDRA